MPLRFALLTWFMTVVAGLSGSGCALSGGSAPEARALRFEWSKAQVEAYGEAVEDAARSADLDALAEAFAVIEGVQPVLDDTFLLPSGTEEEPAGAAAYVPGRWPARRDELVVVSTVLPEAEGDMAPAAAVLALASAYAGARRYHLVPARTVLFAVWVPAGAGRPSGLEAFLRQPTWAREGIRDVYVVGEAEARRPPSPSVAALGEGSALPSVTVLPTDAGAADPVSATRALALRLREAIRPAVMAMPAASSRHESR